jgi:hypothetical protein
MLKYYFAKFGSPLTRRGRLTFGVIMIALLLMMSIGLAYPDTITEDDALAWIHRVGDQVVAETLVKINNDTPAVTLPATIYLLDGRDLVVSHDPKSIDVSLPPYIHYTIQLPDERVKDFAPRGPSPLRVVISLIAGATIAVVADEMLQLAPLVKQAAAVGLGAGGGLAVYLFWSP